MKHSTCFNLYSLLGILFIIATWKLLSLVMQSGIILPSPEIVLLLFLRKLGELIFWQNIAVSASRVIQGFLLSFCTGLCIGILCGKSTRWYSFFHPSITMIRVIPVLAVILIAVIWLKSSFVPVFVSFITAFPIIVGTVIEGMHSLDPKLDQMARVYRLAPMDKLFSITIPQLYPFVIASIRTSLGLTWRVVIAAEILSLPRYGIGTSMQNAQLKIETADVFAWTTAAVLFSMLFDVICRLLLSRFDWRRFDGPVA